MTTMPEQSESQSPCQCGSGCCGDSGSAVEPTVKDAVETCAPGCDCHAQPTHKKARIIISCLVLAAVAVIVILKLTGCTNAAPVDGKPTAAANAASELKLLGQPVASIAEVGTAGAAFASTFLVIPEKGKAGVGVEIAKAINDAKGKLEAKGITTGLFTLKADSPEYAVVANKQLLPAVIVAVKGKGQDTASVSISESRLLQAYVAAENSSAPSGAGGAKKAGGCGCGGGGGCGGN